MLDLDAIEKRANAAKQGPWWVERPETWENPGHHPLDAFIAYSPFGEQGRGDHAHTFDLMEAYDVDTDYDFIAHARMDVPALVAELRRLRGYINETLYVLDRYEPELLRRGQDLAVIAVTSASKILRAALEAKGGE